MATGTVPHALNAVRYLLDGCFHAALPCGARVLRCVHPRPTAHGRRRCGARAGAGWARPSAAVHTVASAWWRRHTSAAAVSARVNHRCGGASTVRTLRTSAGRRQSGTNRGNFSADNTGAQYPLCRLCNSTPVRLVHEKEAPSHLLGDGSDGKARVSWAYYQCRCCRGSVTGVGRAPLGCGGGVAWVPPVQRWL